MAISLAEKLRGLFYAPFYATRALGLFADEGVEVEWLGSATPRREPGGPSGVGPPDAGHLAGSFGAADAGRGRRNRQDATSTAN
jgi:hypothetical protein